MLFPDLSDITPSDRLQTIQEVLTTESFPSRMADLRGALLALQQGAGAVYAERRSQLEDATREARDTLEDMPEWALLDGDDRDAIAGRLGVGDLPAEPGTDTLALELRRLLTRAARLQTVLSECQDDVRRRVPPPPPAEQETEEDRPGKAQVVTLRTLMPAETLYDAGAVERWISDLRRRLVELVELGPVRLVDREDD